MEKPLFKYSLNNLIMNKFKSLLFIFCISMFAMSCDTNDDIVTVDPDPENPESQFDAEFIIEEDGNANVYDQTIDYDASTGKSEFKVRLQFTPTSMKMARLYITRNELNEGEVIHDLQIESLADKADGSINVKDKYEKGFDFTLPISVPSNITDGTVVYRFWTTVNKGDFRDSDTDLALGVATLTVNFGTKVNADAPVKHFTSILLDTPLADGRSNTFVSLLDGTTYNLLQGTEYVAFWDFGYLYGATTSAGLYSASNYPKSGSDVASFIGAGDELNKTMFASSNYSASDFDAIATTGDLNDLDVSSISATKIQYLEKGQVVKFVDNYGTKGLIKIVSISPGAGTIGSITIEVKMQTTAL